MSRRVLIADANVDAADSLALLLQLSGHRAFTAHTGPDALAMAAILHPEAVFLSLHLPRLSGLELCRVLCEGTRCPRPSLLVALTGDGDEKAREASRAAGFEHHLVKPADPGEILKLLRVAPASLSSQYGGVLKHFQSPVAPEKPDGYSVKNQIGR